MKTKKYVKSPNNQKKNRKQIRKELRKQKKIRKNEYYTNRRKGDNYVLNTNGLHQKNDISPINMKEMTNKPKELTSLDYQQRSMLKEKKQQEKLKKQMEKRRREQFLKANDAEDINIKRLEKQLGFNKRKSKQTPKSFSEDGLDYLLEMCDPDNMRAAVTAEQQFTEVNDDFGEDFALMTGKTLKNDDMEDTLTSTDAQSEDENQMDFDYDDDLSEHSFESSNVTKHNDAQDEHSSGEENLVNNKVDTDQEEMSPEKNEEVWEDIYGRLRGKDGNILKETESKYIPPALRAKMLNQTSEKLIRLRRQLKGLLNRLAESNMHNIATQIEELYMNNSRNDMNDTITSLILDSIVTPILTPQRLLMEHVLLITILHANVGTEVGAHFLQTSVKKFDELWKMEFPVENKMLDNIIWIIAELYDYKVFHSQLIYEILNRLTNRFNETDIECILLILKNIGFTLRKDNPIALKSFILNIQKEANNIHKSMKDNPRVKFMLEILLAIKNNNMSKIPNYDTSYSEHLKKLLKGFLRKGSYVTTLNISLEDLLKADEYGKWWVVGSAWSGKTTENDPIKSNVNKLDGFSDKLLDLARKQRMNTDTRRNIFCIIMSAEDYLDAFEKLLHLGLKNQQEREIINVILHCCLQEKVYNPYYAVLAQKFCKYDRKYQMTIKYSVWDKLKTLTQCSGTQLSNLAKLLTHLFIEKGLPISTLKIVEFSELDKITLRFMRQILIGILLCEDDEICQSVFTNVGQSEKLRMFKESLKLFIQHFLLRNLKTESIPEEQKSLLENRAKMINKILSINDKKVKF